MTGVLALLVFVPMAVEAARSRRNERTQRARGGIEPLGDVYGLMRIAYPVGFLLMIVEATAAGARPHWLAAAGFTLFGAAKALKWWAIATLGDAWTFRVIVVPGAVLVGDGPYRFVRHPNYIAVLGELAGIAAACGAVVTGPIVTAAFTLLIIKRIGVEDQALRGARRDPGPMLRADLHERPTSRG
jgi:methyltransferase